MSTAGTIAAKRGIDYFIWRDTGGAMMKKLFLPLIFVFLAATGFGADAANDIILTQRKADNSGNIQRNIPAQNAITSANLPSFQSGIGLGVEDTPNFTGVSYGVATPGSITGLAGALSLAAAGTNQNITLTPSGSGDTRVGPGPFTNSTSLLQVVGNNTSGTNIFVENTDADSNASQQFRNDVQTWQAGIQGASVGGSTDSYVIRDTTNTTNVLQVRRTNDTGAVVVLPTTTSSSVTTGSFINNGGFGNGGTAVFGGNATFVGALITTPQALSGAGAVNVTTSATFLTSTGGAQALSLANGTAGQIKYIVHQVDGGSAVLTPTSKIGFTTITFTNVGDSVTLIYTAAGWAVVGVFGAVAA